MAGHASHLSKTSICQYCEQFPLSVHHTEQTVESLLPCSLGSMIYEFQEINKTGIMLDVTSI